MSTLNEPVAKRIARLFRMLGSPFDGEVSNAVAAMKRLLTTEGLTFNDIATVIEGHNGEMEEKKYSDSDAEIIFNKGVEKGRKEEALKQTAPPEFYDAEGCPRWNEIAVFCQQALNRLTAWEREFVTDMVSTTLYRELTEKQRKRLIAIFVKVGGPYDPKTANLYR